METPTHPQRPWVRALNDAGWELVADRVIHGLAHDFTGRISSLGGMVYLLESADSDASSIIPFFNQELEQMEETVRLLRLLPDDATASELLAPGEVLDDLTRLVGTQRGLENLEVRVEGLATAPAVRADPTLFNRIVAMAMTTCGEAAVMEGGKVVGVQAGTEAGGLMLTLRPFPPEGEEGQGERGFLPRRILPVERLMGCRAALLEEGIGIREVTTEEGTRALQLSFSPPVPV